MNLGDDRSIVTRAAKERMQRKKKAALLRLRLK
jgi:hypothetical protein